MEDEWEDDKYKRKRYAVGTSIRLMGLMDGVP